MNSEPPHKVIKDRILGWGEKSIRTYLIRFVAIIAIGFVITFAIDLYRLQQPEFHMARNAVVESELVAQEAGGIRYVERRASGTLHEYNDQGKIVMYSFFVRGRNRNLNVEVRLFAPEDGEWQIQSLEPKAVENKEVR